MKELKTTYGFETQCVHGAANRSWQDGERSVVTPLYQTAAFAHVEVGHGQFNYTRQDNPTRLHLEETVAALEGGETAVAFASGMAAIAAVFELFRPGDHIIVSEDLYGGTTRLFNNISRKTACWWTLWTPPTRRSSGPPFARKRRPSMWKPPPTP